jgi:GntR family transcriptional repressor for pyruvate dehydrogenase complex
MSDTSVDELEMWIGEQILAGGPPVGQRLEPERLLAERHGVSRSSLRRALTRLERAGLIETRQGSGSRVRPVEEAAGVDVLALVTGASLHEWLGEVFEARRLIGALIAERAADRRDGADVERLRELLVEIRAAPDAAGAQRTEAEFHRVLGRATHNRVFVLLINSLLRAYRPLHARLRGAFADPARVADALLPLVEAIAAGRCRQAHQAALDYFAASEQVMVAALDPPGPP